MFDLRDQCPELLCPNSRVHESFHMLPWPQMPHADAIPVLILFPGWLCGDTLHPVRHGKWMHIHKYTHRVQHKSFRPSFAASKTRRDISSLKLDSDEDKFFLLHLSCNRSEVSNSLTDSIMKAFNRCGASNHHLLQAFLASVHHLKGMAIPLS